MTSLIEAWIARAAALLRALGPYAALELLLPGGSLFTLLLCFRRQKARVALRASEPAAG